MALPPFAHSQALSLGVELELQLVNTVDFDLTSGANDLLELVSRKPFPGTVTPEMTQSMIEIATGIHTRHAGVLGELQAMRDTLVTACERLNIDLCGGGTHPFQRWSDQRVFSKPRFEQISQLYGYLAKQFTVFGQHVHVGCASGDDALFRPALERVRATAAEVDVQSVAGLDQRVAHATQLGEQRGVAGLDGGCDLDHALRHLGRDGAGERFAREQFQQVVGGRREIEVHGADELQFEFNAERQRIRFAEGLQRHVRSPRGGLHPPTAARAA